LNQPIVVHIDVQDEQDNGAMYTSRLRQRSREELPMLRITSSPFPEKILCIDVGHSLAGWFLNSANRLSLRCRTARSLDAIR